MIFTLNVLTGFPAANLISFSTGAVEGDRDEIKGEGVIETEVDEETSWKYFPAVKPIPIPAAKIAIPTTTHRARLGFGFGKVKQLPKFDFPFPIILSLIFQTIHCHPDADFELVSFHYLKRHTNNDKFNLIYRYIIDTIGRCIDPVYTIL